MSLSYNYEMKSTKVQTLGTDHALVHTEHLVGSEDTIDIM